MAIPEILNSWASNVPFVFECSFHLFKTNLIRCVCVHLHVVWTRECKIPGSVLLQEPPVSLYVSLTGTIIWGPLCRERLAWFEEATHFPSLLRGVIQFSLSFSFFPSWDRVSSILRWFQTNSLSVEKGLDSSPPDSVSQGWGLPYPAVLDLSFLPSVTPTNYFESTSMCHFNLWK